MSLELSGKIFQVLEATTGQGANGPWTRRDFVIETMEQYPKKVCFSAWNDKAAILDTLTAGQEVKVSFDAASREYNQKWYTDLRIWKLEKAGSGTVASTPNNTASAAPMAPVQETFGNTEAEDDLPF